MGRNPTIGGSGMTLEELRQDQKEAIYLRSELLLHLSQISRLEGQFSALVAHVKDQDTKIERLQRKQITFAGVHKPTP